MFPIIALIGCTNVGKSTLFNRLTASREALVADYAGLTRDRLYGEGSLENDRYGVIDTGGVSDKQQDVNLQMMKQVHLAIKAADLMFFIVDVKMGMSAADHELAHILRKEQKPVYLIANKIDTKKHEISLNEYYELGLGDLFPITATHGRGVQFLLENTIAVWYQQHAKNRVEVENPAIATDRIKMAIVGRPNVGKSTLVNRLLKEERVIVLDEAGTTRDSIYIPYERDGKQYTLIDTAGVRRKGRVSELIEKFSIIKTLQAIEKANIIILMLSAQDNIVDQDLHLLGHILRQGKRLVIAINKWDGLSDYAREMTRTTAKRRLIFAPFIPVHFISAKHGSGLSDLYTSIDQVYQSSMTRWSSNQLTSILEESIKANQPPMNGSHRIKLRYCHMGGSDPLTLIIHGNQTDALPQNYIKYLENTFRSKLLLSGIPIRLRFKTSDNPFKDKKNILTLKQVKKRKRLMSHIKKTYKK
ncbi:MAG: ribosome biogenesis GTPase Der [Endozoicomonadaceae bacterium]|nr:ribosome biogenesis GTPase Der [Endozoicomonadaceae bacterium]